MKIREAINRLPKNLIGTYVIIPNNGKYLFGGQEMFIRFISPKLIWLCKEKNSIKQEIYPIQCEYQDFLDWDISSKNSFLINERDEAYVDGSAYGLSQNEKVIIIAIFEGITPYPIKVSFKDGRRGQYKREELKMIVKKEMGIKRNY